MKYKELTRLKYYTEYPLRVLKFKRSKWQKVKKVLLIKKKRRIISSNKVISTIKSRNKIAKIYKQKLNTKRLFYVYFGNRFRLKKNLAVKTKRNLKNNIIYKNFFNVKNLTVSSKTNISLLDSKNSIFKNKFLVNNKKIKMNIELHKGDICSLLEYKGILQDNIQKHSKNLKYYSFYQYEPYSQTFIIMKNSIELNNMDQSLISLEGIEIDKLL